MRDIPHSPVALHEVANLFGTLVAETILASVHVRARKKAGHMGASDLIKALQNTLRGGGRPHMANVGYDQLGALHRAIADYGPDEIRLIRRCQVVATKVSDPNSYAQHASWRRPKRHRRRRAHDGSGLSWCRQYGSADGAKTARC